MVGDERVRFCGQCQLNVYNLSAMTRSDGEALVRGVEGRMCVRLYQRTDGTVITADCPVGARRERLRQRVWARVSGAVAGAALFVGLGLRAGADLAVENGKKNTSAQSTSASGSGDKPKPQIELQGAMVVPEPPKTPPPRPRMGVRTISKNSK